MCERDQQHKSPHNTTHKLNYPAGLRDHTRTFGNSEMKNNFLTSHQVKRDHLINALYITEISS